MIIKTSARKYIAAKVLNIKLHMGSILFQLSMQKFFYPKISLVILVNYHIIGDPILNIFFNFFLQIYIFYII